MTLFNKLTALIGVFGAFNAYSAIEEIRYKDMYDVNIQRNVSANSTTFINPNAPISASISAGLDRMVRFQIKTIDGAVLSTATSSLIGINDRITGDNGDYYGKSLSVLKQADGNYIMSAQILDNAGNVVQQDNYPITIDTQGPTSTGVSWVYGRSNGVGDGYLSYTSSYASPDYSGVNNVYDAVSGVTKGRVIAGIVGSDQIKVTTVTNDKNYTINNETGSVWYKSYGAPLDSDLFPTDYGHYNLGLRIWDAAGNYSDFTREVYIDNKRDYFIDREIWNPKNSTWEPYVSGMEVHENPYKIRYSTDVADIANSGSNPEFGWSSAPSSVENGKAYWEGSWTYPANYSYGYLQTKSQGFAYRTASANQALVLGDGVDLAPQGGKVSFELNIHPGVWQSTTAYSYIWKNQAPVTITRLKFAAEARGYTQIANINGGGSCIIPAGEKSCIVEDYNKAFPSSGKGYSPLAHYLCKTSDGVSCDANSFGNVHVYYLLRRWDYNAPIISDGVFLADKISFISKNNDLNGGWDDYIYKISEASLRLTNLDTAEVTHVQNDKGETLSVRNILYTFSPNDIPEGRYKVEAYLRDTFDNFSTDILVNEFVKDATPPLVTFSDYDILLTNGAGVEGLDGIKFKVTDLLSYTVDLVKLQGGPISDDVVLATRGLDDNKFALEYPRIFPTLEEGQEYTLSITATDAQLNTGTTSVTFKYTPPNLQNVGQIYTLPINRNLLDASDKAIASVKATGIRVDSGELINGDQDLVFSLRTDADFAVIIGGVTVQPGQTVTVVVTAVNGDINVPVYPAVSGVIGTAPFFAEIPALR